MQWQMVMCCFCCCTMSPPSLRMFHVTLSEKCFCASLIVFLNSQRTWPALSMAPSDVLLCHLIQFPSWIRKRLSHHTQSLQHLTSNPMSFSTPVCPGGAELGEKLPARAPSVDEGCSRMTERGLASIESVSAAHCGQHVLWQPQSGSIPGILCGARMLLHCGHFAWPPPCVFLKIPI